jgi:hypothetical protein
MADVGTDLWQQWQELSEANKRHFERLAAADTQSYVQVRTVRI